MKRYTEEQLINFTKPVSDTEEEKAENTINMIIEAINQSEELKNIDKEVFLQGSYANNTNVKEDSDVDICVMCKSTFFSQYLEGLTDKDYGFIDGTLKFEEFRNKVLNAIVVKFGKENVIEGNKSIKIKSNTYHINADVVPAFMYKDFKRIGSKDPLKYTEGIKLISREKEIIINYPKIHIENGKQKNSITNHKYKNLVRIAKHITNDMVEKRIIDGNVISSFLVECLVWNLNNKYFIQFESYTNLLRDFIVDEYDNITNKKHKDWGEVSECLYLFVNRKWTDVDVKNYLLELWNFCQYG